jgi:hypothetical protein
MAKNDRNKAFTELAEEISEQMVEISKKIDCLVELLKPKPSYSSNHSD